MFSGSESSKVFKLMKFLYLKLAIIIIKVLLYYLDITKIGAKPKDI